MLIRMSVGKYLSKALIVPCVIGLAVCCSNGSHAQQVSCDLVRLSGASDWYPVSMRADEIAPLEGILPDLARDVFFALKVPVGVAPQWPWKRTLKMLENGRTDVLAGAFWTSERAEKFALSLPVLSEEVSVFVRGGLGIVPGSLEELVGLRGMIPFGASYGEEFDMFAAEHLTIENQVFDSLSAYMQLLIDEKIDYLVAPRRDGEQLVEQMKASQKVASLGWPAVVNTVHYLFSRASPCIELLDAFNEELRRQLAEGSLERLTRDYNSGKARYD